MASGKSEDKVKSLIILAGATGDLGGRIAKELLARGAQVRALVRPGSSGNGLTALQSLGMLVEEVDFNNADALTKSCAGGACVVSALSGLHDVIVKTQTQLLHAAVAAGVPRFIPSDFAVDFTKLPRGTNRNLDFRKEFHAILNEAPIAATSILNGMFADLLTGQAPFVLFPVKRVMYWGDAYQLLDFTTIANTAEFTAAAALDPSTPRYLCIAGDVQNAHGLKQAASKATGKEFRLFRAGGLARLDTLISLTHALTPKSEEAFPAWQGMQYTRNMFSGLSKLTSLENNRYPGITWTSVQEVLEAR